MGLFTYFKIAAVVLLASVIIGAWLYFKSVLAENETLKANQIKLELALEQSERTVKTIKASIKKAAAAHKEVSSQFSKAREENGKLKKLLSKHDLGYLAERKPGLIAKRTTKGSNNVGRCFEILSGSPLTMEERTTYKKSKSNTSCPELANPLLGSQK
ncbi:MAG: hypothetical protein DRI24_22815 [Deltaproteobacteria bacterium]|nr:MAG: hypothetical protein DRI24_22815 [Deltaproteobacteria bacterium]